MRNSTLLTEQIRRWPHQRSTDRQDRLDPDIPFTALDPADVIPVEARTVSEIFLAQSSLQSQRPEAHAEISKLRVNFHPPDLRHEGVANYTLSV